MKHLKKIIPVVLAIVSIYLLKSCSGGNYNTYVEEYKDIAISEMERTGYPASIKLAQAILESEGGRNQLALEFNNHFGIPCGKNWSGKKHYEEEDYGNGEIVETCYRIYNNPYSSFIAHTDLLRESKHYSPLFRINPKDYVHWAEKLTELGYTDNDTYAQTLIGIIEKYNLYDFDEMTTDKSQNSSASIRDYESEEDRTKTEERTYAQRRKNEPDLYEDNRTNSAQYEEYPEQNRVSSERFSDRRRDEEEVPPRRTYIDDEYASNRNLEEDQYSDDKAYDNQRDTRINRYDQYDEEPSYKKTTPSKNRRYQDEEDIPSTTSRPKNERVPIDDKYQGYNDQNYKTRPSEYSTSTNRYDYDQPIANKYDQEYPAASKYRANENTIRLSSIETSVSDFQEAQDYAYINGVKVTTAHYDDTPASIAARFNLSVKDIIHYNEEIETTKQLLREGTKVYLQEKKKNYEQGKSYHIVQFGERMQDIAQMYGLTLEALYEKNKMPRGSEPALGEKIKIDKGKVKDNPELRSIYRDGYSSPTPLNPASKVAIDEQTTTVAQTPITDNYPNKVFAEQHVPVTTVLLQPVTTNIMYHTVKEGETLYRIAHQYGTTIAVIRDMNQLNGNVISKGMKLKVR